VKRVFGIVCVVMTSPLPFALAQEIPATSPFEDELSRNLVTGYLQARDQRVVGGVWDYQALLRTRQRVGFFIPEQWFWRDREMFHKEVAAFVDFNPDKKWDPVIVGKTRGAPMIGDRIIDDPPVWKGRIGWDPERSKPPLFGLLSFSLYSLARDVPVEETFLSGDRFNAFDSTWVDPLSTKGLQHYSYRTGRVLEADGPDTNSLQAIEVMGRGAGTNALAGAIWFNVDTGNPVRAMYRPRGRWPLKAGLRGFAREIPGLPKNAEGEVDFLTVDYGYDTSGPPRVVRAELRGTMYWFFSQVILPVDSDWELDWTWSLDSPEADSALAVAGGGVRPSPDGTTDIPGTTFGATWLVGEPLHPGWGLDTPRDYLEPFLHELDQIAGAPPTQGFWETVTGAVAGVRFNQVQGVDFTVRYPIFLDARSRVNTSVVLATSGFQPTGEVEYIRARRPDYWSFAGYSRLQDAMWTEKVNTFFSSLDAILFGYDDGNYYLAQGGSVARGVQSRPLTAEAALFVEKQSDVDKTETYSLFGPPDPPPPPSLEADPGTIGGIRARLNLQYGDDPQRGVFVGRLTAEGAVGDFEYLSLGTMNDIVGPLLWRLSGGFRFFLAYVAGEEPPAQALWYLGGTKTVRGYAANSASGVSAYSVRAAVATNLPLARVVAFSDIGWASPPSELFHSEPLFSVGIGLSIFDGVARLDFAKGLTRNGAFRISISTSGLL